MDIVRVNDKRQLVEIEADKDTIREGPTFGDEREITPEFERRVLTYYRLEIAQVSSERGSYGPYYSDATGDEQVDVLPGERAGTHGHLGEPGEAVTDTDRERTGELAAGEDELRVPRSEEEGEAKPPERQAEGVNVRKRVRTDRQRSEVPESREEARADRPAAEGRETSEPDTGDDATKTSD
jgi:stress response protein YsnF